MKYTKRFQLIVDRDSFINSANYIEPHASYTIEDEFVQYNKQIPADYYDYFNFKSTATFEVALNSNHPLVASDEVNMQYSFDLETWYTLPSNFSIEVNDIIYLRGNNLNGLDCTDESDNREYSLFVFWHTSEYIQVSGNIMSLIYGNNFLDQTEIPVDFCFTGLFMNLIEINSAKNLILPATDLSVYCYAYMFQGCTNLTEVPNLPATALAEGCYQNMFKECVNLTIPPNLPATALADRCYQNMFNGCTDLIRAPKLPATSLSSRCYDYMFYGCTSLFEAPELPAITLAEYCYNGMFYGCTNLTTAPELPAITLAEYCYQHMFYGCTALTTAPELPATTLARYCYGSMFYGCTNLNVAPELPATTLAYRCYTNMFHDCTYLTESPELPATTLVEDCYSYMFYGTNALPDCSNIDFTSQSVVNSQGLDGLFAGTKVTDNDLRNILPINPNTNKYYLPVTSLSYSCYRDMFNGCTSLTTAPELPATTLAQFCYASMFSGCTNLNVAPELPATTLVNYCYQYMFYNCSSLNYIKAMFTTTPSNTYTSGWVNGVSSTGTFVKNSVATWNVTGINGVPSGWTVQTASA